MQPGGESVTRNRNLHLKKIKIIKKNPQANNKDLFLTTNFFEAIKIPIKLIYADVITDVEHSSQGSSHDICSDRSESESAY